MSLQAEPIEKPYTGPWATCESCCEQIAVDDPHSTHVVIDGFHYCSKTCEFWTALLEGLEKAS